MKVFIFDLDNTLLPGNNKVPRQTWHALKKIKAAGYPMGIVSYNPCAGWFGKLFKEYISEIISDPMAIVEDTPRYGLVQKILPLLISSETKEPPTIYYFDDRQDNIENIKEWFPQIKCHWVSHPTELHKLIKISLEEGKN